MRRRRRPILAACCTALVLAMVALWVRSYDTGDAVIAYTGGRSWGVRTGPGCVVFSWAPAPASWHHLDYAGDGYFTRAGLATPRLLPHAAGSVNDCRLWLPLWMPIGAALLMVGWWMPRDGWAVAGHCAACGYDLLHNVSGICPECGTLVGRADHARSEITP